MLNISGKVLVDSCLVEVERRKLVRLHIGAVHRLFRGLLHIKSRLLVGLNHIHVCRYVLPLQAVVSNFVVDQNLVFLFCAEGFEERKAKHDPEVNMQSKKKPKDKIEEKPFPNDFSDVLKLSRLKPEDRQVVGHEGSILVNIESVCLHYSLVTAVGLKLVGEKENLIVFKRIVTSNVGKSYFYEAVDCKGFIVDLQEL